MNKILHVRSIKALSALLLLVFVDFAFASGDRPSLGSIAGSVSDSVKEFATLINTVAVVAGLGFGVAAAFKFKQHKDNPTQVPLGQPLGLLGIGLFLIWVNFILFSGGGTIGAASGTASGVQKAGSAPSWLVGSS